MIDCLFLPADCAAELSADTPLYWQPAIGDGAPISWADCATDLAGRSLALVLPMAVFFSALLLAISLVAKSFKEAQSYLSPLVIVIILPAVAGVLPGVELNARLALVPILDAQHFLAIRIVAAGFAPEVGRLDGGHQQFDRAGAVLLLLDDALHLHQNLVAQRQPGIEAGGLLADHAGTQHQAVRDDFSFLGNVAQHRQKVARQAHVNSRKRPSTQGFC